MKHFLIAFLVRTLLISSLSIPSNVNGLTCKPSGIQCLNENSFTICSISYLGSIVLACPEGYICDDDVKNYPCLPKASYGNPSTSGPLKTSPTPPTTEEITTPSSPRKTELTNESTVSTVSSATSTSTFLTYTTRRVVERPTGPPNCKKESVWPAPLCNQYYKCVKKTVLFVTSYKLELTTCPDDEVFSSSLLKCVDPKDSDCP